MKKITIIMSVLAVITTAFASYGATLGQKQLLKINAATYESAGKIGKKGTIYIGGSVNKIEQDYVDGNIGGGGQLELALNVFQSKDKVFGLDVALPVNYSYFSASEGASGYDIASIKYNRVDIPVQIRPYFRHAFSKNFMITPFVFASAGVGIHSSQLQSVWGDVSENGACLSYNFGGGVEFQLYKDVAITPKFTYFGTSGLEDNFPAYGITNTTLAGINKNYEFAIEGAVKLVRGWTFVAEYAYQFNGEGYGTDDINAHIVRAGIRFGF